MACKYRPKIPEHDKRILRFVKPSNYREGVLLGQWVEDRLSGYEQNCYQHNSTYRRDFEPKRPVKFNSDEMWKNRIQDEGLEPPLILDYNIEKYMNNYSTTYRLSYDYLPKVYSCKQHNPLMKEEEVDTLKNYGNLVDFGLREVKKCEWLEDTVKPRRNATTYEDHFVEYPRVIEDKKKEGYKLSCNNITGECKVVCANNV